jgi:hypothetical protein
MDSISVRNESGQVVSMSFTSDQDPRKIIVEQRIARGELEKVSKGTKSDAAEAINRRAVEDYHTGLKDERGDLLKSVHGGGIDPDAQGDVLGQPSGSEHTEGALVVEGKLPIGDSHPDAAVDAPNEPLAVSASEVEAEKSNTTTAAKKTAAAKK